MLIKRKLQLFLVTLIALVVFISLPSVSKAADSHNITIPSTSNGTISADASAEAGSTVTITVTPSSGYMLKGSTFYVTTSRQDGGIRVNMTSEDSITHNAVYSFTMPNEDVIILGSFDTCYKITNQVYFPNSGDYNGEVYDFGSGLCSGEQGRIFTNPKDGYILTKLELRNSANDNVEETPTFVSGTVGVYNFTMPSSDVYVYALFEKEIHYYGIDISPDIKGGSIVSDKTEAAVGDIVNLTVKENKGYKLKNIKIQGDTTDSIDLTQIDKQFTMPKTSVLIKAQFEKINNGGTNDPTVNNPTNDNNLTTAKNDSTKTSNTNKDSSGLVKTEDTNSKLFALYTVMSLISIAGIAFIFRYKKQH